MKRLIKYDSIGQLVNAIYDITGKVRYVGRDVNNDPIYDDSISLPTVQVELWEKIHGTNAGVAYSNSLGLWAQSKARILTPKEDNKETAQMVEKNQDEWMRIINSLAKEYNINLDEKIITVYFEQSGGGIQSKSAVSSLDKLAMIFAHFKVSPLTPSYDNNHEETGAKWYKTIVNGVNVSSNDSNIYNIRDFESHEMTLDFNNVQEFRDKVEKMIPIIEKESPVGKQFGISNNVGEGFVITFEFDGELYKFKIKGDEHAKGSGGKKKILTPEEEAENKVKIDFVNDHACSEWRLRQMYDENFENKKVTMKDTKTYMDAVFSDIVKEETLALKEIGLVPRDISKLVSSVAIVYFKSRVNHDAGL